jgi:calcineurin-like phosphoesterase family protein
MTPEGIAQMKEDLLSQFDKLPEECVVWNLGDLYDTRPDHSLDEVRRDVKRMKGPAGKRKLYLVLGNHDCCKHKRSRINFYYAAGFDKVYDSPIIVNDKFIFSHEPVYIKPGSDFINVYGHTHDIPIDTSYFTKDFDNWAMIARVCRKDGLPEPKIEDFIKWPEKVVEMDNYYNVCWDYRHEILNLNKIISSYNK